MSIDWEQIHRQVQRLRQSLDSSTDPARLQQQLAERAQAMASARGESDDHADTRQLLEVSLGGTRYAFEMQYLEAVLPWSPLTPVPGAPDFVLGMLLVRGRVVSCIDLLSFLGLPVSQLTDPTGIVVLADEDMEIGIPVQQVGGMETAALQAATGQLPGRGQSLLLGLTPGGAFVLDCQRLLSDPRLPVHC